MKFSKKLFVFLTLLFTVVLIFTACGSEKKTTNTTTTTTPQGSTSMTTTKTTESSAVVTTGGDPTVGEKAWSFENDIIRAEVSFDDGSITLDSFYNKLAGKDYLASGTSRLFSYTFGKYVAGGEAENLKTVKADGKNWTLVSSSVSDITIKLTDSEKPVGKSTSIVIRDEQSALQITLIFEIYDGSSGMRYQTLIKNLSDEKIVITESDVISLSFPNETHRLHYISAAADLSNSNIATNSSWKSTSGKLKPNTGRNALCVYSSNDGWWIMPETNWRTQYGPENYGSKPSATTATYEFATTSCWTSDNAIKVTTNPDSLMLTLKAGEEFEYIGVNITVFKGDVIDGKMAAEEHFYKRFLYHDTSTIINTNDWYYYSKRTTEYFEEVVIPAAKAAGIDMVMLDDLWNTNRDTITAISALGSLKEFSSLVKDNGFMLGLWYSMSGGDHNNGRDLADPESLAEKIELVESLIKDYGMNHIMIDLTEYWQNTEETDYSSPCDNVYRKNVMVQNALNILVDKYPEFYVKPTNEVDVYPTQGNRSNGLLHVMNNGWVVGNGGLGNGMQGLVNMFGYLPLSATYGDGGVTGDIGEYYYYLFCRNTKLPEAPDSDAWSDVGIEIMAKFNAWRGGKQIDALLDTIKRPSYLGEGWDGADQGAWVSNGLKKGPFAWTYTSSDKSEALLIVTSHDGEKRDFVADMRWLDSEKVYAVADVTLDQKGTFANRFIGFMSGKELVENGLSVELSKSSSGALAYIFKAVGENEIYALYADEDAEEYSVTVESDGKITVTVKGEAGAIASVIIVDSENKTAITLDIAIAADGVGAFKLNRSDLKTADKQPTNTFESENAANEARLEFEKLYVEGKLGYSDDSITVGAKPDDCTNAGASGGDYRKVEFPSGDGSYITVPVNVKQAGTYKVTVAMKSNENQAKAAIGIDGKAVSEVIDLSTGVDNNKIYTLSCKLELKAGENLIYIICVGKGANNSNSTRSLRIDYIEYAPFDDESASEAEALSGIGSVVEESKASNGKALKLNISGLAGYVDIPTSLEDGRYSVELTFIKTPSSPKITVIFGGESHIIDLYSSSKESVKLTFTAKVSSGSSSVRIIATGINKSSSGYDILLDTLAFKGNRAVSADKDGYTVKVGEGLDLSKLVTSENGVYFLPLGETVFNTAVITDGALTAKNVGTVIIRCYDKVTLEHFDITVTVVSSSISEKALAVIEAVNSSDTERADSLYTALSEAEKKLVTNYPFMKRQSDSDGGKTEGEVKDTYYLEELDYIYNDGSNVREGSCPSGSHSIMFTEDGEIFEHGLGFEATTSESGTLYVKIPENAKKFTVKVGLDSEMSKANYSYDQKNTVKIWIDGKEVGTTGVIKKNMQNGAWVDNSYSFEITIPEGAEYLLIENNSGGDRTCDHILLADAKFSAK